MLAASPAPLIFIVAGEPSGDLLGADLIAALREACGEKVSFAGVGGVQMAQQGFRSLFPMADLSVMGLVEILPRARQLLRRLRQTADAILERRPDIVVTIDSPGFNLRLARRLSGFDRPLVHYVAPSVWAWRESRAHTMAGLFDHLLALLPFEPPYFERAGLPCSHVGHPAAGRAAADGESFRRRHGLADATQVLAVLPGSRVSEVRRLLPAFLSAASLIYRQAPGLRLVTVTVPAVEALVADAAWPVLPVIVREPADRHAAFAACDAAIAASGTVALELAAQGTPMVVCYRVSPLTYAMLRPLVRIDLFSLVNLTLGRRAVPELIQQRCTPENIAHEAQDILFVSNARAAQITAMAQAVAALRGPDGEAAESAHAARIILDLVGKERRMRNV